MVFLAATGEFFWSDSPKRVPESRDRRGSTSTARSFNTGNLIQEIAWSDAGGGLSSYEPTPPYQSVIAHIAQGSRALPDVSADANPNNGYWVYDSIPIPGDPNPSNWWLVGGTSASTPLVAGIIAIRN